MRAAMAALVWLAAALVAFDAPSLGILGSETEAPAVTSDRVPSGHAGLTPPDRRVEDPDGGERSASPPVPRGPADPDGSGDPEDDEDDGDDGGSGVLPGDGADDRDGTGSTGSLP